VTDCPTNYASAELPALKHPALRYHGGKFRLSKWIQEFFPEHTIYVEPYGGAASVLLTKPRAYAEVYNDLDGDLVNFFRVLQDPSSRERLCQVCAVTPYAREEFALAFEPATDPVERARRLAIRAAMGFGSAGATKETCGFRRDATKKHSTAWHNWVAYPEIVAAVGERLTGVMIENREACQVMVQNDGAKTLHYVDPPYLHSTRGRASMTALRYYRHEMSVWDHAKLLAALQNLKGMVVLSGYPSELYEKTLQGWERHETTSRIALRRGAGIRTESVWLNPKCAAALA